VLSAVSRSAAGLAAAATTIGGGAVIVALGVLPHPWSQGYVSEGGVATSPRAWLYVLGIISLAAGLALLGLALRRFAPFVCGLLLTAGAFGSLSGVVSCTPGCPLPPYEQSTPTDVVHAGASVAAVGLAVLAMLCVAYYATHSALRGAARVVFAVSAPLMVLLAVGLLAVGRGMFTSVLERVALATVLVWMLATAAVLALDERRPGAIGADPVIVPAPKRPQTAVRRG
jgi:hypothetical protein